MCHDLLDCSDSLQVQGSSRCCLWFLLLPEKSPQEATQPGNDLLPASRGAGFGFLLMVVSTPNVFKAFGSAISLFRSFAFFRSSLSAVTDPQLGTDVLQWGLRSIIVSDGSAEKGQKKPEACQLDVESKYGRGVVRAVRAVLVKTWSVTELVCARHGRLRPAVYRRKE